MPMVEKTLKVSTKADHRAIGGLSMGGGQSMNIAFNRPELFRYVLLMSPAAGNVEQVRSLPQEPVGAQQAIQGAVARRRQG
jgi:enterochelin esterase-like enzyme